MQKIILFMCLVVVSGCSSRGPMKSFYGPIETPKYVEVIKSSILEEGEKVEFATEALSMPEARMIGGAILVTDNRILFASWDAGMLQYLPSFSIPFEDIESYGSYATLNVTIGLLGKSFYVKTSQGEYYFASDRLDSVFYYIKKNNVTATKVDS